MKVEYREQAGDPAWSKAYLDTELPDGSWTGENKHTGLPVHVRWDGQTWVEVCHREWVYPYARMWDDTAVEVEPRPPCGCWP